MMAYPMKNTNKWKPWTCRSVRASEACRVEGPSWLHPLQRSLSWEKLALVPPWRCWLLEIPAIQAPKNRQTSRGLLRHVAKRMAATESSRRVVVVSMPKEPAQFDAKRHRWFQATSCLMFVLHLLAIIVLNLHMVQVSTEKVFAT